MVQKKDDRGKDYASLLLNECEKDAKRNKKAGICTFSSSGTWIASDKLFIKNRFTSINSLERFELMAKKVNQNAPDPMFVDWLKNRKKLKGWHLIYSHQCPWHIKSVEVMIETASKYGIKLNVKELKTSADVRKAPTGYGTFSLIKDGRVLEDHYLSKTRFETIIKKELNSSE